MDLKLRPVMDCKYDAVSCGIAGRGDASPRSWRRQDPLCTFFQSMGGWG